MASITSPERFSAKELRDFLAAIDLHLRSRVTFKILGGSACLLAYGVDGTTQDIDTFETSHKQLARAVAQANRDMGLHVPVSGDGGAVGDWPWNSDDRLIRLMPELAKLQVYSLEAHDLALSKAVRGWEKDLAMVRALHQRVPLDLEVLYHRFTEEMGHAIGPQRDHDLKFLALVDRLFGTTTAERIGERLRRFRTKRRG